MTNLEHRLESLQNVLPEQKDVADTLRRMQGLATQSNLTLVRFTPAAQKQLPLYAEVPYRITALGSYHNLGAVLRSGEQVPAHHQRRRHLDHRESAAGSQQHRRRRSDGDDVRAAGQPAAGEGAARRPPDDDDDDACPSRDRGAVGASSAQVPDPTPAINAAKNAKAKTEAAQQKNAEALDQKPGCPRRRRPRARRRRRRRPRAAAGAAPAAPAIPTTRPDGAIRSSA